MSDYIHVEFAKTSQEKNEILVAHLSQCGYNGFEEKDNSLHAFIVKEMFDKNIIDDFAKKMQTEFTVTKIEETNWNQLWESSFDL